MTKLRILKQNHIGINAIRTYKYVRKKSEHVTLKLNSLDTTNILYVCDTGNSCRFENVMTYSSTGGCLVEVDL